MAEIGVERDSPDARIVALRRAVSYNPETGEMFWLMRTNTHQLNFAPGKYPAFACPMRHGYLHGRFWGKSIRAHRVAWAIYYGEWPSGEIDHINGDTADNRICNLRDATKIENRRNKCLRKDNKTGYPGIRLKPSGRYNAYYMDGQRMRNLGTFHTLEEAVAVRKEFERVSGFHPNHGRPSRIAVTSAAMKQALFAA